MSVVHPDLGRRWTVPELGELPDDGLRYELVDGCLVVTPPPTQRHQLLAAGLRRQLDAACPPPWRCEVEFPVALAEDTLRQADVAVFRWPPVEPRAERDSTVGPGDVGLLVEVVSPSTRRTDRFAKPGEYAEAGVALFWRLETDPALVLHAFRLEAGSYVPVAQVTTLGRVPAPWGVVEVDLTGLDA